MTIFFFFGDLDLISKFSDSPLSIFSSLESSSSPPSSSSSSSSPSSISSAELEFTIFFTSSGLKSSSLESSLKMPYLSSSSIFPSSLASSDILFPRFFLSGKNLCEFSIFLYINNLKIK